MYGVSETPTPLLLITANGNAMVLDEQAGQILHHNVAMLRFMCKPACPDILTAVDFLCTRVKCPDDDELTSVFMEHRESISC